MNRRITKAKILEAQEMKKKGYSYAEISAKLNISQSSAVNAVKNRANKSYSLQEEFDKKHKPIWDWVLSRRWS